MKIYTKKGDYGMTSLLAGGLVPKNHIRLHSYGSIDELNSWIGLIRDSTETSYSNFLLKIQNELFILGAVLATLKPSKAIKNLEITNEMITDIEHKIDDIEKKLPQMTYFILPGGHPSISYMHIARTVCRRSERHISAIEELDKNILIYINRLSDFLFVLSRKVSQDMNIDEVKWIP